MRQAVAAALSASKSSGKAQAAEQAPPGSKPAAATHQPENYIASSPSKFPGGVQPPQPSDAAKKAARAAKDQEHNRIWIREGEFVRPIEVQVGVSDGVTTEVSGDKVKEGMDVVIGEIHKDASTDDTTNPFAPSFKGGKGK
jgi:hypothetical protein